MQKLIADQDVRIRVGGEKVNLNKWDIIEVPDQEVMYYLTSGFHRQSEANYQSWRVVKTTNEETKAMLKQRDQDHQDNLTPDPVINEPVEDPAWEKRKELLNNQQSPFEKGEIVDKDWNVIATTNPDWTLNTDYEIAVLRNKYLEVYWKEAANNKYWQDPDWLRKKIKEKLDWKESDDADEDDKNEENNEKPDENNPSTETTSAYSAWNDEADENKTDETKADDVEVLTE